MRFNMLKVLNTRILLSGITLLAAAALIIGGTFAFFSDSETSKDNLLQAGAIDLGIDNHSYYNGVLNPETTWRIDYDIDEEQGTRQFFNFTDLKPGDWGEDTISLHVKDNDSWLCADVTLTSDNDNGLTEPEGDDGDLTPGPIGEGELADAVNFYWWADDGDNVFESCESEEVVIQGDNPATQEVETSYEVACVDEGPLLPAGPMGNLDVDETATVALADSDENIWGEAGPLTGDDVRWVGKAWCFGDSAFVAYPQDGGNLQSGPDNRPVVCDGSGVNNVTQTDSFTADISFRAVQSRNNLSFQCEAPVPTPTI